MDCFHGSIGDVEAERRLREQRLDSSYLFRESVVESGLFILSHINNERVKHVIVPSEAKCYDDCILDMEHLVGKLNAPLVNPVPPPSEVFNYWRPGWRVDEQKCPVCSLDFEDKAKQRRHLQVHKLTECSKCHKYEPTMYEFGQAAVRGIVACVGTPTENACDFLDFILNPGMRELRSYLKGTKDFLIWIEKLKVQYPDLPPLLSFLTIDYTAMYPT